MYFFVPKSTTVPYTNKAPITTLTIYKAPQFSTVSQIAKQPLTWLNPALNPYIKMKDETYFKTNKHESLKL